jgi:hypothetical protein
MVCIFRESDVAGIDVNMGCPKDFSLKVISEIHFIAYTVYLF